MPGYLIIESGCAIGLAAICLWATPYLSLSSAQEQLIITSILLGISILVTFELMYYIGYVLGFNIGIHETINGQDSVTKSEVDL